MSFRCTFPFFSFSPPSLSHYYPIFILVQFILSYVKLDFWTFLCLKNIFLFEGESISEFTLDYCLTCIAFQSKPHKKNSTIFIDYYTIKVSKNWILNILFHTV